MIVQVTNSGGDLGEKHFDIQMPGGGFGIFNGCAAPGVGNDLANGEAQFVEPYSNWGARYGGLTSSAECAGLPPALRAGCEWRFNAFKNANNPGVFYRRVQCPAALKQKSGCWLEDDASYPQA